MTLQQLQVNKLKATLHTIYHELSGKEISLQDAIMLDTWTEKIINEVSKTFGKCTHCFHDDICTKCLEHKYPKATITPQDVHEGAVRFAKLNPSHEDWVEWIDQAITQTAEATYRECAEIVEAKLATPCGTTFARTVAQALEDKAKAIKDTKV